MRMTECELCIVSQLMRIARTRMLRIAYTHIVTAAHVTQTERQTPFARGPSRLSRSIQLNKVVFLLASAKDQNLTGQEVIKRYALCGIGSTTVVYITSTALNQSSSLTYVI